jgi:hypothetical protein
MKSGVLDEVDRERAGNSRGYWGPIVVALDQDFDETTTIMREEMKKLVEELKERKAYGERVAGEMLRSDEALRRVIEILLAIKRESTTPQDGECVSYEVGQLEKEPSDMLVGRALEAARGGASMPQAAVDFVEGTDPFIKTPREWC